MLFIFLYYLYYKQFYLSYNIVMLFSLDFALVVKESINLILLAKKNNIYSFYILYYKQELLVYCFHSILCLLNLYYTLTFFFFIIS
jgi:hypothetical protein